MRSMFILGALASLLSACGADDSAQAAVDSRSASRATAPQSNSGLANRTGELLNPDASTMVLLYYDLAGIPLSLDRWVEDDRRVRAAAAADKAAQRIAVRAEVEAGAQAVHDIGRVRLTMNANLSEYDPTYGEFTVRALAPSSVVPFEAFDQKVSLQFANGRTAQIWRVPAAESRTIRDRISHLSNVTVDVLVKLTSVRPGPGGGTLVSDVVEYELRDSRSGATIGRVQIAAN